jgi:NAD(P)-dependent dehydrogenase (short-subunit alcohol dehydrogenase family)
LGTGDARTVDGTTVIAQQTIGELGGLDTLINNAGDARAGIGGATAVNASEWLNSLNINLLAAMRSTNPLPLGLRQSDVAAVVNISSSSTGASQSVAPARRAASNGNIAGALRSALRWGLTHPQHALGVAAIVEIRGAHRASRLAVVRGTTWR